MKVKPDIRDVFIFGGILLLGLGLGLTLGLGWGFAAMGCVFLYIGFSG